MAQVKDVVCGMTVETASAQFKSAYQGQTYYFCSAGCKQAFDKEPEKYVKPEQGDHGAGHEAHGHHGH
jgi:YHS domain-containing protein